MKNIKMSLIKKRLKQQYYEIGKIAELKQNTRNVLKK